MARRTQLDTALSADAGSLRARIARVALDRVEFGSVSLIPVRFEHSRISGPFEDGGRTLYCVSTHMKGRTFGKAERPKIVVQEDKAAGRLRVIEDDEVCTGHRTEPFPELETLGNPSA
ncbi:hypothetical protein [Methylobacterium symbioticum]|nr:hypothetical protein [Methylobacterium symbioticum]